MLGSYLGNILPIQQGLGGSGLLDSVEALCKAGAGNNQGADKDKWRGDVCDR